MTTRHTSTSGSGTGLMGCLGFIAGAMLFVGSAAAQDAVLRVCADPNNLPQSHRNGEGYENRIAAAIAQDLGWRLEYSYFPQRMGFVRNTLRKQDDRGRYSCDVIIGVPVGYELTATTRPYLHSTYVLLVRASGPFAEVRTSSEFLKKNPDELARARIGVFARSPGVDWLLRHALLERAVTFPQQSGDPDETPTSIVERALAAGNIDAAILWGPMAGYLMSRHAPDAWRIVTFDPEHAIQFDYQIAMGVRFGEADWKNKLDDWIARNQSRVQEILQSYHVPLIDLDQAQRSTALPAATDPIAQQR